MCEGGGCVRSNDINKSLSSKPISFDSVDHEAHIVSPLVGIGTPPPPLPPSERVLLPWTGGGACGRGGGRVPFSDDWRKSLELCLLSGVDPTGVGGWHKVLWRVFREDNSCVATNYFDVRYAKKDHFQAEQSGEDKKQFSLLKNVSQKLGRLRGKSTNTVSAKRNHKIKRWCTLL